MLDLINLVVGTHRGSDGYLRGHLLVSGEDVVEARYLDDRYEPGYVDPEWVCVADGWYACRCD